MLKRPLHALLVLVFALLQCVAPLVHAHVDGQNSGLIPPAFSLQSPADEQLALTDCVMEASESAAIGLAHKLPRNEQAALPQPIFRATLDVPPATVAEFNSLSATRILFFTPYSKSLSQAPPTLG